MKKMKKPFYSKRVRCAARIIIVCITVFIIAAVSLSMTGCGAVLRWAEQAKMRANKTASTYNNYILKNEFVWNDNVPEDIYMELETID